MNRSINVFDNVVGKEEKNQVHNKSRDFMGISFMSKSQNTTGHRYANKVIFIEYD